MTFENKQIVSLILSIWLFFIPTAESKSRKGLSNESSQHAVIVSETVTISKIIDGDTFVLSNGKRIRLLGLDTPEKGEPFSEKAKIFAEITLNGKPIKIETEKVAEDKYGRLLAYVFIDGKLYNEIILKKGFAWIYFFNKNHSYARKLLEAQSEARKAKAGIWSLPEPVKEPYYIAAGGSFRFHRPLCLDIKNINLKKAKKYKTRSQALDAGLSPCRECKP